MMPVLRGQQQLQQQRDSIGDNNRWIDWNWNHNVQQQQQQPPHPSPYYMMGKQMMREAAAASDER